MYSLADLIFEVFKNNNQIRFSEIIFCGKIEVSTELFN
jgi:hypothetical protein